MRIGTIIVEQLEVEARWLLCFELTLRCADVVANLIVMVATVTAHALFL